MADNSTKIILTAEDKTAAAFASAKAGIEKFSAAYATLGSLAGIGVVAGIAASIKSTIDFGDQMNDLSQRVGISVKDLATWKLAAEQSGTSLESVAKGVKGLSQYMVEHGDKLREAGITARDANGALVQLADLFSAMPDGIEKTALAVQLFGKAGMDMIPVLNLGSAGLAEARKKAADYARAMADLAPEADKFNDAMRELKLQSEVTAVTIAAKLAPGMEGLALWIKDARSGTEGLANALEYLSEKAGNSELLKALSWLVRESGSPRSKGYPGPKNRQGLPANEMEMFDMATEDFVAADPNFDKARARAKAAAAAAGLMDKPGRGGAGSSAKSELDKFLERIQKDRMAEYDKFNSEESMFAAAEKNADLAAKAVKDYDEALKKSAESLYAATDPGRFDALGKEMATAQEAFNRGFIDQDKLDAINSKLMDGTDALKAQRDAARELGMSFSSAFEDAIVGAKSVSDALQGLAKDVARIFVRKTVTEPLGNSLVKMFEDMNLFGGSGAGVAMADGGAFQSADLHHYANTIVGSPTLFKFAQGGSFGLMGEAGAEAIMPLKRGSDGKLGVRSDGGGGVTVNIIEDSSRGGQVQARRGENGQNLLDVFVDRVRAAVAGDIASGSGAIPAALGSTYGLNRAAGGY